MAKQLKNSDFITAILTDTIGHTASMTIDIHGKAYMLIVRHDREQDCWCLSVLRTDRDGDFCDDGDSLDFRHFAELVSFLDIGGLLDSSWQ